MFTTTLAIVVAALMISCSESKVYNNCELAKVLLKNGIPKNHLGTYVCIAHHESNYSTSVVNHNTGGYGIFQISSKRWCMEGDKPGHLCNVTCKALLNDDLTDDIRCVKKMYQQNGFTAWDVYKKYCAGNNSHYVAKCGV